MSAKRDDATARGVADFESVAPLQALSKPDYEEIEWRINMESDEPQPCQDLEAIADFLADRRLRYPVDHPHLSIHELCQRGWTPTMIDRLLGTEDRRDPVNHFRNFSGKSMYALDRVERIESLPRFEKAFRASARRRRLPEAIIQPVLERCAKLRAEQRWLQSLPELSEVDKICNEFAGFIADIRRMGYRTPHKC